MQTLALDGRTGASGDMILGALIAAGADPDRLSVVESVLDVEYRIDETTKNGIRATTVDVLVGDGVDSESEPRSGSSGRDHDDGDPAAHGPDHEDSDHGGHTHDHEQDSAHSHDHDSAHEHAEGTGPSRTYAECRDLVGEMGLPSGVESDALAVFRRLGEAEASVHGTDLETTHFHEVGADDAIADIVGAALLFDDLGADRVVTTPVSGGGGEVSMSHGVYPAPTPAVTYLAEAASWRLRGGPLETELLTPTGAAILAHFADGVDSLPAMDVEASGYGAGSKSFEAHANVLRATFGDASESPDEATAGGLRHDGIRVLETNLDDATPETLGGLDSRLRDAGARDVTILPATMKKSRPGHVIRVIVKPDDVGAVARRLAVETGTLGIRETPARHRWVADRTFETVVVAFGDQQYEVTVKIAADADGEVYDVSAEYDDAERVAGRADVPVREVRRRAEAAYRD
jgi:uncharacterized protein (TIGR00299 family) protein